MAKKHIEKESNLDSKQNNNIIVSIKKGANYDLAESFAERLGLRIANETGNSLSVVFDESGISLEGYGMRYQGDFENMLFRLTNGRLQHEMLVKAGKIAKNEISNEGVALRAVDATAGMGEDAILLAAYGYEVTMYEQNPIIALLLRDALRRARKNDILKDIVDRMTLVEGNSIDNLGLIVDKPKLIYLDPMFPERQKSGLINKKLQLIQKLEPPCVEETKLFDAAVEAKPSKIVVKRPLKSPHLADRKPNYMLKGKAIRYDCYVF